MQQTKLGSLIEALMNIAIGYGVALLSPLAAPDSIRWFIGAFCRWTND